ncbi:MAG: hypothetical protein P1U87_03055 [Verrucomicrobiales bacterium]|nr:hypothetical protein [Verrucomicrobiales bacterium]
MKGPVMPTSEEIVTDKNTEKTSWDNHRYISANGCAAGVSGRKEQRNEEENIITSTHPGRHPAMKHPG